MAIAKTRIHIICGICGCNDMWRYEIAPTGNCDYHCNLTPAVYLTCGNCASLTNLDELMKDVTPEEVKNAIGKLQD